MPSLCDTFIGGEERELLDRMAVHRAKEVRPCHVALLGLSRALCRVQHPNVIRFNTLSTDARRGLMGLVMEFADEAALKAYTDSPAQKEWYKVYIPVRDSSTPINTRYADSLAVAPIMTCGAREGSCRASAQSRRG